MLHELPARLARRRPRVVVLGEPVLDGWLEGVATRLCREGPVPVVDVTSRHHAPGAAANTAATLARLGAHAVLVGVVGDDDGGRLLRHELATAGVDQAGVVVVPDRVTVTKRRVLAGGRLVARFDDGDRGPLAPAVRRELRRRLQEVLPGCDAVLVSEYGLGHLDAGVRATLASARAAVPLLVVDAHRPADWAALTPDVATPNAAEAAAALGGDPFAGARGAARAVAAERLGAALRDRCGARAVVLTLDRDGAVLLRDGEPAVRTRAVPAAEEHAGGGGDTFAAALTLALAGGADLWTATRLAQAAATVAVSGPGTSTCAAAELTTFLAGRELPQAREGVVEDHDALERLVTAHRAAGRRIVFTNGCFDVVHRAHVAYLEQARRLGDLLLVAVNSDASVSRLKGPTRPVNTAADRAAVLAGLACVDVVTVFADDTPVALLRRLRPEVYVKGGDYSPEMLAETPVVEGYGGVVRTVDYVPDHSTTAVIERITARAAGR